MAELWLIGAGLGDERDLSRRAVDRLRRADALFTEEYTSLLAPGSLERLSQELGRPIVRLDRAAVESAAPILGRLEAGQSVALLVAGDPYAATTHLALRTEAERRGHAVRYLPNASILTTAAGALGLQPYRFGRPVSLPFPTPSFAPTSPLERMAENRQRGEHTLVLLDLDPVGGRFLTASAAISLLDERDPSRQWLPEAADLAVVARLGREDARAWYGPRTGLRGADFGPPLHALVVPAPDLHEEEARAVARFRPPDGGPV